MITGITLENFKGFRHLEIQPKRITAFVGPNGTGKSSVLQAFGLLKQTVDEQTAGEMAPSPVQNAIARPLNLVFKGPLVNLPNTASLVATFGEEDKSGMSFSGTYNAFGAEHPHQYSTDILVSDIIFFDEENPSDTLIVFPLLVIRDLKIVPALRGFTQPVYKLGDALVKDVSLEPSVAQQEAQTATNLGYAPAQLEKVSRMLKAVTGVGLKAITVPPQSVDLRTASPAGPINIVAEGFGANSLIMLLLQLVSAEPGATVMIEEPEIHLHPKAQADLAEVLAAEARAGDKQVIMTTHSEHITGRLLTLVAEGKLPMDDLAIYAFEKDAETGVCSAKSLKISEDGGVEGGVRDFFDTNLAEMNRYVEAQFAKLNSSE